MAKSLLTDNMVDVIFFDKDELSDMSLEETMDYVIRESKERLDIKENYTFVPCILPTGSILLAVQQYHTN